MISTTYARTKGNADFLWFCRVQNDSLRYWVAVDWMIACQRLVSLQPFAATGAIVCNAWVYHAAAMAAPLETRMDRAMAITPSKCAGKR